MNRVTATTSQCLAAHLAISLALGAGVGAAAKEATSEKKIPETLPSKSSKITELNSMVSRSEIDFAGDKAIDVISNLLSADPDHTEEGRAVAESMKECAKLENANTRRISKFEFQDGRYLLMRVQGEKSGFHVILGKDCKGFVVLNAPEAVLISYVAESFHRKLPDDKVAKILVPVSLASLPSESKSEVSFLTTEGRVSILKKSPNIYQASVVTTDGKIAYLEQFETKSEHSAK